ncbi:hypothetical protein RND71_026581 [Anisodus tanguticus]|uniref:Putative plant transposon protein domain-containing protein n=1 Tax=Anisodus tanguticus TaxID=243964 RepID=A0AAE1RNM6_9SOLA|nr:hypothetical protein RND71_026581 [Anisodus tanguticus]
MRNFCREARVWLRLLNYRIMPLEHYSSMKKERVSIVYFLMKGLPINIGYWMMKEMRRVRECKAKSLSYGNTLTTYLMMVNSNLAHSLDTILEPLDNTIDTSKVMALGQSVKHNLTPIEEHSRFRNPKSSSAGLPPWLEACFRSHTRTTTTVRTKMTITPSFDSRDPYGTHEVHILIRSPQTLDLWTLKYLDMSASSHFNPLAWAVVDKETKRSWSSFIEHLKSSLEMNMGV